MGGYQRILVGVDGSAASLHTLREAFRLGQADIAVVAVVPPGAGRHEPPGREATPNALVREPYERALTAARELAQAAGRQVETLATAGEAYERIVALAEARGCDLIVMGLKGPHLPEQVLMGSTTARVIGFSKKDVLVIPAHTRLGFARVLSPTDGSRYSDRALARALEICRAYGGELQVVSVLDAPADFVQEAPEVAADLRAGLEGYVAAAQRRAETQGIKCRGLVGQGPASQIITELALEEAIDLIVMGSHGRTGLKRLLMGSVTERVIGLAPCPVLVVKA
jgi:nucleotide-binding universal stress UspA family protein